MLCVDAHLDLSMNATEWNRDLRWPVDAIRKSEQGMTDLPDRGKNTVSFPSLREGHVGLVVATQIARVVKPGSELPGWHSQEQAWAHTQGQLQWYRAMEEAGELFSITDNASLETSLARWEDPVKASGTGAPIGYLLSLEGADSILSMEHLERAYHYGLRAVGPAHYGPGIYANGTNGSGRLNSQGIELLRSMEKLCMILDVTHLNDEAFWHALECYAGPIWASHSNCRSLVDHNRQFSDEMFRELFSREAVIGVAMDAWMLVPGWIRGKSDPAGMNLTLETLADHIDHICQLAGNSLHVGIGSDLDGGYGKEQCPQDLETIADIRKLPGLLQHRGYSQEDIRNILHMNFIRFLKDFFP